MDPEEIERMAVLEERSKRNEGRIKQLEQDQKAMNEMVITVKCIAQSLTKVETQLEGLNKKVNVLESKPGKRWESIVEKVIGAAVLAVAAFVLGRLGL